MSSSHLLIAFAVGVIVALIIFWWNPESLQNDNGEPTILWVILIGLAVAVVVYWFLNANGYDLF